MQVTTINEIDTYTATTKGNNLFDVFKAVVKKITTALTPAKKPKFSNASVVEAIEYIEWRTKYDQRRIVQHVNVLTALVQSPKLCSSLDIKEPTYRSSWFNDDRLVGIYKLQSKTRELLESPKRHTVNPKPVDRFEATLAKFTTGFYKPRTQALMSGKGVTNAAVHRSSRKRLEDILAYSGDDADMLSLQNNMNMLTPERILASAQAQLVEEVQSCEERILNEMCFLIDTLATSIEEEQIIEVKVAPVTEPQVTEQPTEVEPVDIKKVIKDLNKLTIPKLKAFAKERGFKLSGRTTQISAIRASIVRQLKESSPQ